MSGRLSKTRPALPPYLPALRAALLASTALPRLAAFGVLAVPSGNGRTLQGDRSASTTIVKPRSCGLSTTTALLTGEGVIVTGEGQRT